jgi:O-antigen ligase/polysaccharide polymerase Wzy-like membrane protein
MNASALELAGMLVGCAAAACAIAGTNLRWRKTALILALAVAPALVLGDVWDEERVVSFRDDPPVVAAASVALLIAIGAGAALMRRLPAAFPLLALALLPLRVPVEIGGETANLLIPLYVVIAAGAIAWLFEPSAGPASRGPRVVVWLRWALAATLVLYAIQTAYSEDVSNAIENTGFFLIPFAALFVLLGEVRWTRRLLGQALTAIGAMAALFGLIAIYQYAARDLFLNDELFDSNQLHVYFRVNSLFFDPNVLGRYLALAIVAIAAYLAWNGQSRNVALATLAAGVALVGLAFSYSLSSFAALLAGLGMLALLRWSWRGALAAGGLAAVALVALLLAGGTPESDIGGRDLDSGHTDLIEGGLELAEDQPIAGWGSGSFGAAFVQEVDQSAQQIVSHAEPVTVAAEQGAIGVVVYLALLGTALGTLLGARPGASPERSAVAACFIAMIVHSIAYAAFVIDPATWTLLALGVAFRARAP